MLPPLWKHQQRALDVAKNKFALFFDPGCGKTRTGFELLEKVAREYAPGGMYCRVLIFAPLNVCRNWVAEATQYVATPHSTYLCAGQTKYQKQKIINEWAHAILTEYHFLICNIESLRSCEYRNCIKSSKCNFVIVDESHNFKSPSSLQTKGLFDVLDYLKPKYLYLLTGTPCPNGELDLWSTFRLLDVTKDNFYVWRKKYFEDKNARRAGTQGYYPDYIVKPSSKALFNQQLQQCSMTARKEEVLELPDYVRTTIYCELSKEQRKHYMTMREFLFAANDDGTEVTAQNVLTRTLRMQQIIGGIIGDGTIKDNPRLKALHDAIDMIDLANPQAGFIIWTVFQPTYEEIGKLLHSRGISYAFLIGDVNVENRYVNIRMFQDKALRCLIAHPKAGGVGVNLTAASYSIHYLKSYSLTDDLQSEARNYRGGSEIHKKITRIDIVAEDTIDEDINEALAKKKTVQEFIMGLKNGL